ncbi:alpha/beta fold hydrolase [Pantanalinema rosaneae CENA516]|uniref:alpha/beta fold hydrolase n=1 Tax=Pantanalinema rosaneae TaxID=1620701 RepID=UPI003D6F9FBE
MTAIVLIHGASSGAWVWHKVIPLLEQPGHTVIAPDLPGHGKDRTPLADISLSTYVDFVCNILEQQPEPVLLVGHSMGGGIITQVAEYQPDKIKALVYLAGYLLNNGETVLDIIQQDTETLLLENAVFAEDQRSVSFRSHAAKDIGFGDCSDADMALVQALLSSQAVAPLTTPVNTTAEKFGRVPRVYIECLQDRAIGLLAQRRLQTALPCEKVISLDTSHAPFFSAPQALAQHLLALL